MGADCGCAVVLEELAGDIGALGGLSNDCCTQRLNAF
jgi:hypothetical protein